MFAAREPQEFTVVWPSQMQLGNSMLHEPLSCEGLQESPHVRVRNNLEDSQIKEVELIMPESSIYL